MTTKKSTKTRKTGKRDSVKSLRETVEVLETQVAEQAEELEKKSDKNVRLLAEFDNYKSPFSWRYGSPEMRAIFSVACFRGGRCRRRLPLVFPG